MGWRLVGRCLLGSVSIWSFYLLVTAAVLLTWLLIISNAHFVKGVRTMQRALHIKTTVQPGGKVEFASPELEAGQTVDVVVLHESRVNGRSI